MPFTRKTHPRSSPHSVSARSIFVGRANELLFFVQHILKPEEPAHNILSVWGQGGVGKTTLLQQFKNQAATADFKAYCLTALVDERQTTPASMMEKLAYQLHLGKNFEKALQRYKEALQFLPLSKAPSSVQETIVTKTPDIAGALVEVVTPVQGATHLNAPLPPNLNNGFPTMIARRCMLCLCNHLPRRKRLPIWPSEASQQRSRLTPSGICHTGFPCTSVS